MSQEPSSLRRKPEPPEDEGWLITFADMSVLLMCFFVLLFSISTPDAAQFKKVQESLREKGFFDNTVPNEDSFENVKKELAMALGESGYDKYMSATANEKSIDVELSSTAFFEPGSARFTPAAVPMLEMVSAKIAPLAKADVLIEVEGHTDDTVVASERYPSNWELSSARAATVVRYIIGKGFPPEKLKAVGLAATRPKAPNQDADGNAILANQDLNRRVVVRLVRGEDR